MSRRPSLPSIRARPAAGRCCSTTPADVRGDGPAGAHGSTYPAARLRGARPGRDLGSRNWPSPPMGDGRHGAPSRADVVAIGLDEPTRDDGPVGPPTRWPGRLAPAIVWQDRRTADVCDGLRKGGSRPARATQDRAWSSTPYFSATKLQWLLDAAGARCPRPLADRGELAFGTVDSWLTVEPDRRPRSLPPTGPMPAERCCSTFTPADRWDEELLDLSSGSNAVGAARGSLVSSEALRRDGPAPVRPPAARSPAMAGDQQAALFGQACFDRGPVPRTRTAPAASLLMHTGTEPVGSAPPTVDHRRAAAERGHDLRHWRGASSPAGPSCSGSATGWGSSRPPPTSSRWPRQRAGRRRRLPGAGLRRPRRARTGTPYARGTIVGLTRGTTAAHLARAALDGIAFQVADVIDAMRLDTGLPIRELRVDGFATANDLLMQTQADLLQVPVIRPEVTETTALGAAYLAGLAVGFWSGVDELRANWRVGKTFEPAMSAAEATHLTFTVGRGGAAVQALGAGPANSIGRPRVIGVKRVRCPATSRQRVTAAASSADALADDWPRPGRCPRPRRWRSGSRTPRRSRTGPVGNPIGRSSTAPRRRRRPPALASGAATPPPRRQRRRGHRERQPRRHRPSDGRGRRRRLVVPQASCVVRRQPERAPAIRGAARGSGSCPPRPPLTPPETGCRARPTRPRTTVPPVGGARSGPVRSGPASSCRLELEHGHLRPAPVEHPLAVAQAAVDVQMSALDGVVTVREVPEPLGG